MHLHVFVFEPYRLKLKRKRLFSLIPDSFCFYFEWFNTVQVNLPLLCKKICFVLAIVLLLKLSFIQKNDSYEQTHRRVL